MSTLKTLGLMSLCANGEQPGTEEMSLRPYTASGGACQPKDASGADPPAALRQRRCAEVHWPRKRLRTKSTVTSGASPVGDTGATGNSYTGATGDTGATGTSGAAQPHFATASSSNSEEAPVQAVAHSSGSSSKRPMEDTQGETPEQNEEAPARKYQRQEENIEEPGEMLGRKWSGNLKRVMVAIDLTASSSEEAPVQGVRKRWKMNILRPMQDTQGETPEQNEEAPTRKYQRQKEEIQEPEDMGGSLMRMSAHIEKEDDVAEMYSPERVTAQAKKWGLRAGEAMDITTGWNSDKAEDKQRAWDYIEKYKPKLIVGSPMCTMFSSLQMLSGWDSNKHRRWMEAKKHIEFMIDVYLEQLKNGRWFLHGHPSRATSWSLDKMKRLVNEPGVQTSVADQCMYGLVTWGKDRRNGL